MVIINKNSILLERKFERFEERNIESTSGKLKEFPPDLFNNGAHNYKLSIIKYKCVIKKLYN